MFSAVIFIIVLGILVFVHELGHFITAKRAGMKVEEFGFGFPPRLWGLKRGETIYSINLIPFGGFVKILGEDGAEKSNPRSFASRPAGPRSVVLVAGVVMNVLLAFVFLVIGNIIGLRIGLDDSQLSKSAKDIKIQVIEVVRKSPAEIAGIKVLNEIVGFKVGGKEVLTKSVSDVQDFVSQNRGRQVAIEIKNGNTVSEHNLVPRENPPPGEGALGISLAATGLIKYPWYQAVYRGGQDTGILLANTVYGYGRVIKNAVISHKGGADLSGPIGIAVITGQAARLGFAYLLQFTALISINLAVLNIIPFPALDGGRLLFVIIEKIKRSPVSKRVETSANAIGFALLILLMIYVTSRDIARFF